MRQVGGFSEYFGVYPGVWETVVRDLEISQGKGERLWCVRRLAEVDVRFLMLGR